MRKAGGVLVSVFWLACSVDGRRVGFSEQSGGQGGTTTAVGVHSSGGSNAPSLDGGLGGSGVGGAGSGGGGALGGEGGAPRPDASSGGADAADAQSVADAWDAGDVQDGDARVDADDVTHSACGTSYVVGDIIPEITTAAVEFPMGFSAKGDILMGRQVSPCSATNTVLFAERASNGYVVYDLTGDPDLAGVLQGHMALGSDGKLMIFTKGNRSGFLTGMRDGGDVGALSEGPFTFVNQSILSGTVGYPALAADGLTFTFQISWPSGAWGIFQAIRADTSAPFGVPTQLTGDIDGFWWIDGLTHDGLTAFVDKEWFTTIFTRARTSDPFVKSDSIPLAAFGIKPGGTCGELLGFDSQGGCQNGNMIRMYIDTGDVPGVPRSTDGGTDAAACPYSSNQVDGSCAPVCGTQFGVGPSIAGISTAAGETPMGLSSNGDLLFTRSVAACGADSRVLFAERTGTGYNVLDLTGDPDLSGVLRSDMALGLDGQLMIVTSADRSRFLTGTRNGSDVSALVDGPFDWINQNLGSTQAPGNIGAPVLSGDQLTFTYSVTPSPGQLQIYEAHRRTTADRFPTGVLLTGDIEGSGPIQSLSYDGLTAFVLKDSMTTIFTRARVTEPFAQSGAASLPATAVKVAGSCGALVGMTSSDGCQSGDIVTITAH